MLPWSFILDIVKPVLTEVFKELAKGQLKAIKEAEVKNLISATLSEQSKVRKEEMEQVVHQVMHEVRQIISKYPDFRIHQDGFESVKPAKIPVLPFRDKSIEKSLFKERLERLDKVIELRRKEFQNQEKVTVKTDIADTKIDAADTLEWVEVKKSVNDENTYWKQRVLEMKDRIRRRHDGETL